MDCISHDLLKAKLYAYGFDWNALARYPSESSQKTKVGSSFSCILHMIDGVSEGSTLRPILSNINLCHLFLSGYGSGFTNFPDDNTPCECVIIKKLEKKTKKNNNNRKIIYLGSFCTMIQRQMHVNFFLSLQVSDSKNQGFYYRTFQELKTSGGNYRS